ncbi:SMR family transporter [Allorhodopirellula heiligendammensis]|uniref:Quaternary ammonium compound-resistance protein SugE n=1 Tax=Allorhodopirellula heiligendammensis TaxID=2714739 RepID=A0A5C6C9E4_9BACT|nr:SMR family transporter [Allorhodopirellula heiligendammensis]TWU19389.1 Quaternary ammonium compound-resistance protein SugE [Allorhodopirellula heiligendammensis]
MVARSFCLAITIEESLIGTSFLNWSGIGTGGTATLDIVFLGQPASAMRVACIALMVAGIVGWKLV